MALSLQPAALSLLNSSINNFGRELFAFVVANMGKYKTKLLS
jgi:hypothetical protein